jgi:HPt (histidine-containing phosphotransfer) domain-containing protein
MTAHATAEDRQRCLKAGMDDYLSKPVRGEELVSRLLQGSGDRGEESGGGSRELRVGGQEQQSADAMQDMLHAPSSMLHSSSAPLNAELYTEFVSTMGGTTSDALCKVVTFFLRDTTERLETLQQALARQDAELLFQVAHAMKAGSAMMGALRFSSLCKQLEAHGRTGNTSNLQPLLAELTAEFARVEAALQQHTPEQGASDAQTCTYETEYTIEGETLKHLPQTWLKAMHYAATLGSIEHVEALIAELVPQHAELAEQFTWLVEQFRFQQIVAVLEPLLHEEG